MSAEDLEQRLWDQVHEAQQKHAYFKVGAALSAMAFTVHTTQGETLDWQFLPFGVAVVAWAISAFCGFKAISLQTLIKMLNAESLAGHQGRTALLRGPARDSLHLTGAVDRDKMLMDRADQANDVSARLYDWNWWLLLGGGIAFLIGHVWRMAA